MVDEKTCFIIMPITTPENMDERYRDGKEHFKHVLDCLFIPAVKEADFVPIPPIAKGSDLIHAEIIKNLETSDLVLCDMSCLNPNVFLEFGIRTSLNKPVCLIKDEFTGKVPFDTGIINHHEYQGSFESWDLDAEIKKLVDHIKDSAENSHNENTLWKYFGMKSAAEPYSGDTGPEAKIDYLSNQMEVFGRKMDAIISERTGSHTSDAPPLQKPYKLSLVIKEIIHRAIDETDAKIHDIVLDELQKRCIVYYEGNLSEMQKHNIRYFIFKKSNFKVDFLLFWDDPRYYDTQPNKNLP